MSEPWRLLRFAVVGVIVAAVYIALYLVFLRFGVPQILANLLAFLLAVLVQYLGQSAWTFRRPLGAGGQALRFACTIGFGLLVSALVTGYVGPALGLPEWLSAALVTVILPIQNYLIFRSWVFTGPGAAQE